MTGVGPEASLRPTVKNDSHGSVKVGKEEGAKLRFLLPNLLIHENVLLLVPGSVGGGGASLPPPTIPGTKRGTISGSVVSWSGVGVARATNNYLPGQATRT